jgi:cytochrome P450
MTVDGWQIPAGSRLITSPWVTHRDPRWWGEDVADFRPTRWLNEDGQFGLDNPGHTRMAYFPFGIGPRICIGEQFAWMEAVLVIATLMRQWSPQILVDVEPMPGPMLRTAGPVTARIEARSTVPTEPVPVA